VRAVVMTKHGPPEAMQVQERPDPPAPGRGEVTVDVAAVGINFAEVLARIGLYPSAPKPPSVLGFDIAGTVSAVGDDVQTRSLGDRVFGMSRYGGYAERTNTLAGNLALLPERLTFEQGAAVPSNYSTAWMMLVSYGGIQFEPNARVLVHGAAGGTGIAATQIAKRYGAEVWGTASASKHAAIREFGVDHAIDYRASGWEKGLPKFNIVLDPIGGRNWRTSYSLLRPGGRTINYGASAVVDDGRRSLVGYLKSAALMPRTNLIKQLFASKCVMGLSMFDLWEDRGTFTPWLEPLLELIEDRTINPVIDTTFGFEKAPDAHRRLTQRKNVGKVVLITSHATRGVLPAGTGLPVANERH
jgi:NADPH:quinone reductase-like Zn-dependent oxidoreductase